METTVYKPAHPVRIVTSAALFDGHDASINIMRRILQASGCEVIHLGHNRSVEEIVQAALQEDAQGVAVTSYQGGHMEFFTYMRRMLDDKGAGHVRIYGGGGGVIVPREIEELHAAGISRIFSPEDGRNLGLQGMINEVVRGCDYDLTALDVKVNGSFLPLARAITVTAVKGETPTGLPGVVIEETPRTVPVIGLTGTGGAGKSSLTDELVRRFTFDFPKKQVAIVCVDPTRRKTGGALLGDRIRFNSLKNPRVFMRSLATRSSGTETAAELPAVLNVLKTSGKFDLIFVETAGIGQGDSEIVQVADLSLYVMTAEYGAPSQLEKIEMLDYADFVVVNKFTRRGSEDALRDVRKQYQRNQNLFSVKPDELPVFGTSAAHFNDSGVNALYAHLVAKLNGKFELGWQSRYPATGQRVTDIHQHIIPPGRERYLSEISAAVREYKDWAHEQAATASELDALRKAIALVTNVFNEDWTEYDINPTGDLRGPVLQDGRLQPRPAQPWSPTFIDLATQFNNTLQALDKSCLQLLRDYEEWESNYSAEEFKYTVRGHEIRVPNYRRSLSELPIRKVTRPQYRDAGDRLLWRLLENVPGEFPYTAGTFPYKRQAEDPTRMFAGEGPAARTNARFHLLADGQPAQRLSTAFDSITLYGEDPDWRPDIYGKIGESGVSIFTVEEAEQLYAGFDLVQRHVSVSMTINGPAPTILAFFFNTAIRQQCRKFLREQGRLEITEEQCLEPDSARGYTWEQVRPLLGDDEYSRIVAETLAAVRGTVQADILKEDQGQNTCIFSTEFALKLMGDVQSFFIDNNVRNFYSVSISGYHIAEAGANPIHQVAFTLANGFTYVEYYLARGMAIDDFAPNLSFFFSNGMDPEYSVIGRVARRIWAIALRDRYGANPRSQMLKYHIQTSGRSLHALEIDFNDIRTTLQALLATYDNAQSLHTNAYDEAITTPTDESVRRAMAIQLIINKEFGLTFCENATQGSFIIEELTQLVDEAILAEFDRISERGGVLGAMERQYQRSVIQDDSMKYEQLKHSGALPVVGVNTFLPRNKAEASVREVELRRASKEEKEACIARLEDFKKRHSSSGGRQTADSSSGELQRADEHAAGSGQQAAKMRDSARALRQLQDTALAGGNIFAALMEAVQHCSLGQITHALYEVGGEYRRNM